jgi:hypothetical protein
VYEEAYTFLANRELALQGKRLCSLQRETEDCISRHTLLAFR